MRSAPTESTFTLTCAVTATSKLASAATQLMLVLLSRSRLISSDLTWSTATLPQTVGGEILDEVLKRLKRNGRVVICGASSQYNGNLNVGTVPSQLRPSSPLIACSYVQLTLISPDLACSRLMSSRSSQVRGPSQYLKLAERGASMVGYNVMFFFHKVTTRVALPSPRFAVPRRSSPFLAVPRRSSPLLALPAHFASPRLTLA